MHFSPQYSSVPSKIGAHICTRQLIGKQSKSSPRTLKNAKDLVVNEALKYQNIAKILKINQISHRFLQYLFLPKGLLPLPCPLLGHSYKGEIYTGGNICNPYDIKFNNGYYLLISYIICVSSDY